MLLGFPVQSLWISGTICGGCGVVELGLGLVFLVRSVFFFFFGVIYGVYGVGSFQPCGS